MFQPVVPVSGLAGWAFLQKTYDRQIESFSASPSITRDTAFFEAGIGSVATAEQLVEDRRLLRVALGAFGLQDDIDNRFLVRKILEEGTSTETSLANRLSDERYKQLAEAFGFDRADGPRTAEPGFRAEITAAFRTRQFEVAVGEQDQAARLALNAQRELAEIAVSPDSEETRWFRIMGTPPLRQVFETALGLPDGFAQLDIDRQLEVFRSDAKRKLGLESLDELANGEAREELVRTFLLRDQIKAINVQSPMAIALSLLQSGQQAAR